MYLGYTARFSPHPPDGPATRIETKGTQLVKQARAEINGEQSERRTTDGGLAEVAMAAVVVVLQQTTGSSETGVA